MSTNNHTPDDNWFDALGHGQAKVPDQDKASQKSARWIRSEVLRNNTPVEFGNSPAHQTTQLTKLMARLDHEGAFKENIPVTTAPVTPGAPSRISARPKFWIYITAPMMVTLLAVGIIYFEWEMAAPVDNAAISRGEASIQQRLTDNPAKDASTLCAELAAHTQYCNIVLLPNGVRLSARLKTDAQLALRLHALELTLNPDNELTLHFIQRQ